MEDWVTLTAEPAEEEIYMIAGWEQWADAGSVSSGLPLYLIDQLKAQKIGEMNSDGFYLFQIPGTHHLLRPEVDFEDGYNREIAQRINDFYYAKLGAKGLVLFTGDEPHMNADRYTDGLFWAAKQLNVRRMAIVGGVYGAMPYEKDREVSCTYSLPSMKKELEQYAVRFSNYNGGATIGSYIVDRAESHNMEVVVFNAFVPAYDFSQTASSVQGVRIDHDFKAWYELMRRFNYMFGLGIDLSDLDREADQLTRSIDEKIVELEQELPKVDVQAYLATIADDFEEKPFMPLDDVWERELGDLFDNLDDEAEQ